MFNKNKTATAVMKIYISNSFYLYLVIRKGVPGIPFFKYYLLLHFLLNVFETVKKGSFMWDILGFMSLQYIIV